MPGVREFLLRLKPAGAPGSAAAAGVPTDPKARASDELEPVFAALRPALMESERQRSAAQNQAEAMISAARKQARTMLDQADGTAAAERARVAANLMARAEAEVTGLAEQAQVDAAEVQRATTVRQDARIAQVLAHVRQQLSTLDGETG